MLNKMEFVSVLELPHHERGAVREPGGTLSHDTNWELKPVLSAPQAVSQRQKRPRPGDNLAGDLRSSVQDVVPCGREGGGNWACTTAGKNTRPIMRLWFARTWLAMATLIWQ